MMLYLCVVIVKRERFNTSKNNTSFKVYHIKVDWETHQLLVKYRDKLSQPMAGPIPLVGGIYAQADYKGGRALKSCHSEFHRIL